MLLLHGRVKPLVQIVQPAYAGLMSEEPKDVRLPLMVTRSEAEAIDNWRFENRVATRAEALRMLIQRGLLHGGANPEVRPTVGQTSESPSDEPPPRKRGLRV